VNADATKRILQVTAKAGETMKLDATSSSDPDGDKLAYHWFVYPEPGTYRGSATMRRGDAAKADLLVPADAAGKTIHVILQVTDNGTPPLTRYRRIVVSARRSRRIREACSSRRS